MQHARTDANYPILTKRVKLQQEKIPVLNLKVQTMQALNKHLENLLRFGHVHKYEAVLWTLEKLRKTIFCYKMINTLLRELKFSVNMYFSYTERFVPAKVEKVLLI